MKSLAIEIDDDVQQRVATEAQRLEVTRPLLYRLALKEGITPAVKKLEEVRSGLERNT